MKIVSDVGNFGGAFVVLAIGLVGGVIVSILEFIWNSRKNAYIDRVSVRISRIHSPRACQSFPWFPLLLLFRRNLAAMSQVVYEQRFQQESSNFPSEPSVNSIWRCLSKCTQNEVLQSLSRVRNGDFLKYFHGCNLLFMQQKADGTILKTHFLNVVFCDETFNLPKSINFCSNPYVQKWLKNSASLSDVAVPAKNPHFDVSVHSAFQTTPHMCQIIWNLRDQKRGPVCLELGTTRNTHFSTKQGMLICSRSEELEFFDV